MHYMFCTRNDSYITCFVPGIMGVFFFFARRARRRAARRSPRPRQRQRRTVLDIYVKTYTYIYHMNISIYMYIIDLLGDVFCTRNGVNHMFGTWNDRCTDCISTRSAQLDARRSPRPRQRQRRAVQYGFLHENIDQDTLLFYYVHSTSE